MASTNMSLLSTLPPQLRQHTSKAFISKASRSFVSATTPKCSASDDAGNMANKTADEMKSKAGDAADEAYDLKDKAKKTMEDAWGSVKEGGQKVKEKVTGMAEDSMDVVKDGVEGNTDKGN